jgi:hypothetical protein
MRIAFLILLFIMAGCSSDSDNGMITGPDPNDNGNETPVDVSFANDVLPIFTQSCSGSGCHMPGSTNGVSLGSWSAATSSVGLQYGGPVIIPGNALGSPLVDKLGSNPGFGVRMPDGRGALSSTQIQTIVAWIDEGALNN